MRRVLHDDCDDDVCFSKVLPVQTFRQKCLSCLILNHSTECEWLTKKNQLLASGNFSVRQESNARLIDSTDRD